MLGNPGCHCSWVYQFWTVAVARMDWNNVIGLHWNMVFVLQWGCFGEPMCPAPWCHAMPERDFLGALVQPKTSQGLSCSELFVAIIVNGCVMVAPPLQLCAGNTPRHSAQNISHRCQAIFHLTNFIFHVPSEGNATSFRQRSQMVS